MDRQKRLSFKAFLLSSARDHIHFESCKVLPRASIALICDIVHSSQMIGWHRRNASDELECLLILQIGLSIVSRFSANFKAKLAVHSSGRMVEKQNREWYSNCSSFCYQPWGEAMLQKCYHEHQERKLPSIRQFSYSELHDSVSSLQLLPNAKAMKQ